MSIELLMILAVSLPFIGGLIAYVLRGQAKRASIVATIGVASSFLFAILIIPIVTLQPVAIRFEWLSDFQVGWYVDRLSAALLALVGFISMLVHLFSSSYLQRDPGIGRYYFKLGFFTSSMLGLLIADHLLLLFVFWELVGFSSYLLIGFWYQEIKNARGSRIAFMTNRVADAGFLMGILIWLSYTGNGFMSEMEPLLQGSLWLSLAGLGLLVGALGKSAQFPFFTWLPHAMAGPTPASALIHAATMVAAGVYLLARVHMIFTPEVLSLTAIAGAVTAFTAAFAALRQFDIKKVLAYSTISQLGYMVMGVGVGAYDMAVFHLWTHAFFKAGLFLSAGAIIHYLHHHQPKKDAQDMRLMGGLQAKVPLIFYAYLACMLSLSGLPLFTGFLSKDGIILGTVNWAFTTSVRGEWVYLVPTLAFLSAFMTAFYMGRQLWYVFFGSNRGGYALGKGIVSWTQSVPLILLAAGSIWLFYSINPFAHEFGFVRYLFSAPERVGFQGLVLGLSLILSITGLGISLWYYKRRVAIEVKELLTGWSLWSYEGLFVDRFYQRVLVRGFDQLSNLARFVDERVIDPFLNKSAVGFVIIAKVADFVDQYIVDGLVGFSAWLSGKIGLIARSVQSGKVHYHFVWAVAGIILILIFIRLF